MSVSRVGRVQFKGRGPNGRRICAGICGDEIPSRRVHWCGRSWCMTEWKIRNWPSFAREQVWKRDRGVCALCGDDAEARRRAYEAELGPTPSWLHRDAYVEWCARRRALQVKWGQNRHQWEADHIVPVVEGGGGCGLDNLRTLCLPCHKLQTKMLAARRARARRRELRRRERVSRWYR